MLVSEQDIAVYFDKHTKLLSLVVNICQYFVNIPAKLFSLTLIQYHCVIQSISY